MEMIKQEQKEGEPRERRYRMRPRQINECEIKSFIADIRQEIILQGGDQFDCGLITRQMAINAIRQQRTPEDVAWAIMQ